MGFHDIKKIYDQCPLFNIHNIVFFAFHYLRRNVKICQDLYQFFCFPRRSNRHFKMIAPLRICNRTACQKNAADKCTFAAVSLNDQFVNECFSLQNLKGLQENERVLRI